MTSSTHIAFNTSIGMQKPESIRNRNNTCPFCQRDLLENILAEESPFLLLKNKFPVLEETNQTVIIETNDCQSELSKYSKDHLHRLFRFAIKHWVEMEKSNQFKSVILFKNQGPLSGGSIAHPHMQIVGMKNINYLEKVEARYFEGIAISEKNDVEFNISTSPMVGFYEFNVILHDFQFVDTMSDYIQVAIKYLLNDFVFACSSYNLFFYQINDKMICKITPRYVTTPIFVGYFIPQVPNNLDNIVSAIQEKYFS